MNVLAWLFALLCLALAIRREVIRERALDEEMKARRWYETDE